MDESYNVDTVSWLKPQYEDTDGLVQARILCRRTGFTTTYPWMIRVDHVGWIATQ